MIRTFVKPIETAGKIEGYALMLGDREIGRSKLQCDAEMHMHAINEAMDHNEASAEQAGYDNGYSDGYEIATDLKEST